MASTLKYGIISDIHANYVALRGVLNYLQAEGVDKVLCLGDLVGYGDEPFRVIDWIRGWPNIHVIAGNHDRQVVGEKDPRMRKTATKKLQWTAEQIDPGRARYLRELPCGMTVDDFIVMVHGSLVEQDAYILTPQEISKNLQVMATDYPECRICLFGHTHLPMLISAKAVVTDLRESKTIQLGRKDIYLINPGSVGQPRDRTSKASFAIFDAKEWTVSFMRLGYG